MMPHREGTMNGNTKLCNYSVARRNSAKFTFRESSLLSGLVVERKLNAPASMLAV